MKALVIYDSQFGNTEQVAWAIGNALGTDDEVETNRVGDVQPEHLSEVGLLIVGSPTQRFRPTMTTSGLLNKIPEGGLLGINVAAFDTRFTMEEIEKSRILPFFVSMFGYAAKPIADKLAEKGGKVIAPPEGFYVEGIEGPLQEGELERAANWARQIKAAQESPKKYKETIS